MVGFHIFIIMYNLWKIELYLYPPSGPHLTCNAITVPLSYNLWKKA